MDYFISFQNGYYFVRYLMWNFVGRQNDLEGNMESTKETGFPEFLLLIMLM
jgi:hypothetical protein